MFATDGVINTLLGVVGIHTSFSWLGNKNTAIWTLIILAVWQFGSSMLIFLSSLKPVSYTHLIPQLGSQKMTDDEFHLRIS